MTRIPAGILDRRVDIEQPVVARDAAYGAEQTTWSVLASVWARVTEADRAEDSATGLRLASRRAVFRIRYRADVTAKMRIAYGGQKFNIVGDPVEVGRKIGLDITGEAFSV